jgi:hypothetical protein
MVHAVKTLPEYFKLSAEGKKPFEIRINDRPYREGDFLALNEWSEDDGYTGRCIIEQIICIIDNPDWCKEGYIVMGVEPVKCEGRVSINIEEKRKNQYSLCSQFDVGTKAVPLQEINQGFETFENFIFKCIGGETKK